MPRKIDLQEKIEQLRLFYSLEKRTPTFFRDGDSLWLPL